MTSDKTVRYETTIFAVLLDGNKRGVQLMDTIKAVAGGRYATHYAVTHDDKANPALAFLRQSTPTAIPFLVKLDADEMARLAGAWLDSEGVCPPRPSVGDASVTKGVEIRGEPDGFGDTICTVRPVWIYRGK